MRNEDTEKKKNHMRQKIGLYLYLNKLEKLWVGESIRKKFDGLLYDGETVSLNLDTQFYHRRYTDEDEEDMAVVDVQRYWIFNEVNNKKRGNTK